ncbi:MAG TPA: pilus assembly PilX N-terminal domain-containing protein [Candidatus Acidoferrum sp.]|jgi:uncharacterized membrane protein YgcG
MPRRKRRQKYQEKTEAGVALLIAIFVLLLVSVVAISLIVSSGTETALGGNYRSSTNVYYAAMAGLEEARGRMLPKNPAPFALPPLGQVVYIKNPLAGEDVLATYPDTEYGAEFAGSPFAAPAITSVNSVSGANTQNLAGPSFKWVRINAITEKSLNIDVDNSGSMDNTTPLCYDGAHLTPNCTPTNPQAFEITVLAVETTASPNPSQRLLQYVVAPKFLSLNPLQNSTGGAAPNGVPAAVTFVGSLANCPGGCPFSTTSSSFRVNGNDQGASCAALPPSIYALGVTDPNNLTAIVSNLTGSGSGGGSGGDGGSGGGGSGGGSGGGGSPPRGSHYSGSTPSPSVGNISSMLPPGLQNAGTITQLAQTIQQNADKMITGSATEANMPSGMSASNPMTVVVNGDLTLNGSFSGSGLLLVTGNFTFSSDSSWQGLILVVGQGTVTETPGTGIPGGQIDGSIVVASISPNPLAPVTMPPATPTLGSITYHVSGANGAGVHYNSCNINSALPMTKFQTLSFREIPQ